MEKKSKRPQQCRRWCFTVNNWTEENIEVLKGLESQVQYLIYGKEVGESGTPHLQGYVQLKKALRFAQVKKILPEGAHIEIAEGSGESNKGYCSKEGDFTEVGELQKQGARTDLKEMHKSMLAGMKHSELLEEYGDRYIRGKRKLQESVQSSMTESAKKKIAVQMESAVLRPWQQNALDNLETQNDREILFIVDTKGNNGKTFFAKYLVAKYDAFYTPTTTYKDVVYAYQSQDIVVIDLARSSLEHTNYSTMEHIKNGIVFNSKYESQMKIFEPPKIIVMMNQQPDTSKLSEDRIQIMDLVNI